MGSAHPTIDRAQRNSYLGVILVQQLSKPIYLDYNATTPIDPSVFKAMVPYLTENFGNPSSGHSYGQAAKEAVAEAREKVSGLIGAEDPSEIVFTSGGTESDNQAIVGSASARSNGRKHIITSRIEHPAVMETCRYLKERFGFRVTYLRVDKYGSVNPQDVEDSITNDTFLITIMHANNEVGTIEPIEEIGEIARRRGILFHTDAAQSCGKIEVNVDKLNVDILTIAGHKMYAPKGIGALYVRKGTRIDGFVHGAGQESGRRAGTENVPYTVGLGEASEIAGENLHDFRERVAALRDQLHRRIAEQIGEGRVSLNGHPERRLPNTLNVSIAGIVGEQLLAEIPHIAASTGSACHSGSFEPSKVLLEMGLSRKEALGTLRLSLGLRSSEGEVKVASKLIAEYCLKTAKARYTAS